MSDQKILEKKIGAKVSQTPEVSVIIPAYNVADFIVETLDSIFGQTFENYEIVLVNDGSPDTEKLEQMLAPYFEKIIYLKQKNGGTAAARNTAIENAGGEFLAFLDGDDIWLPEYLESQLAALKTQNCDLICADAEFFGDVTVHDVASVRRKPSGEIINLKSLINGDCSIITSGIVARRETILRAGMFDEELPRIGMEDFDLWFRVAKAEGRIEYRQKILLKYRLRMDSLSGSIIRRVEREINAFDIIERKYELNDEEKMLLAERRRNSAALLALEKGKRSIAEKDFPAAREYFTDANRYHRKLKLTVLTRLLQINPQFVHRLFKTLRPAEFSFVSPSEKVKVND
ncbi:MAG: glycosyltransferase family 2 protein [Pyrinomonadaceae bacterium]